MDIVIFTIIMICQLTIIAVTLLTPSTEHHTLSSVHDTNTSHSDHQEDYNFIFTKSTRLLLQDIEVVGYSLTVSSKSVKILSHK